MGLALMALLAALSVRAQPPADELERQVLGRVEIVELGDPRGPRLLRAALHELMRSPTARLLCRRFVDYGPRVSLYFGKNDDSELIHYGGKETIVGQIASTESGRQITNIRVNASYFDLKKPAAWIAGKIAADLAHEMLGHALETEIARSRGLGRLYEGRYAGNETNAALNGWVVSEELGLKKRSLQMWRYLESPRGYLSDRLDMDPSYAVMLSSAQMSDPLPVYELRVKAVQARKDKLPEFRDSMKHRLAAIDHFIRRHGRPAKEFAALREGAEDELHKDLPVWLDKDSRVLKALDRAIRRLRTHPEELDELREAAALPYWSQWEKLIAERGMRLKKLMRGRTEASEREPWPKGQIDAEGLAKLIDADLRHFLPTGPRGPDGRPRDWILLDAGIRPASP